MAELFSAEWMASFAQKWNEEPELTEPLGEIGFNSTIGYGFPDDDQPTGVLVVENGKAVSGGAYEGQELNWDIRASEEQWKKWMAKPPGMMGLGTAFASGKMKFKVGDYASMLKEPRMAKPFIKSFSVMAKA